MRILYIAAGGKYGSDRSLLSILSEAQKYGHNLFVIINKRNGLEIELGKKNIPYSKFRLGLNCFEKPNTILEFIEFPIKITLNIIRTFSAIVKGLLITNKFKPDIIHSNVGLYNTGYYLSRITRIPHVQHLREYEDLDFNLCFYGGKKWFEDKLSSKHNYSIAISKSIYNHFHLDNNGIISNNRNERCDLKDDFFVYVGNVNEKKGVTELVEAFCGIPDTFNFRLLICGEYEKRYYNQLINRFGDATNFSKISFLGYLKDTNTLLKKATAIIVPSFHEALGRTVIEAMNNYCLVIGRDSGGIKEQFDNGLELTGCEVGIRFKDVHELEIVLTKLVNKEINYDETLELAETVVHHFFEIEKYYPQLEKIYSKCNDRNSRSFSNI